MSQESRLLGTGRLLQDFVRLILYKRNMRLCVTIPVLNEEKRLPNTIAQLHPFLTRHIRMNWEIVIASNGSTDSTVNIAQTLAQEYTNLRVVHFDKKGRGGALKRIWLETD